MKSPAAIILLALCAGPAAAQETAPVLYHVQNDTIGCANPSFTRLLTAARDTRRKNPVWLHETMERGRCVSVTRRSPWKLVLLEGDVALMSHAGGDGPPGAYYLSVAQLIDAAGHHPGEAAAAPPVAGPAEPQASAPTEPAPEPPSTPAPPVQPEHHRGIVPVVIIAALAILAAIVVIALQGGTRRRHEPYL